MKQCPKCKISVEETYLFCHKCGRDLRIPLCADCGGELPQDAIYCPWCGKQVAEEKPVIVPNKLVFTEEDQALFKKLLESHFAGGRVFCSAEQICWEESCSCWGAIDDTSWTDTTMFTIRPLHPDEKAKYAGTAVLPAAKEGARKSLLQEIAENSDRCLFYEALSAHCAGKYYNVHWKNTMVVSNPYGVGMDVVVVYESYDDQD